MTTARPHCYETNCRPEKRYKASPVVAEGYILPVGLRWPWPKGGTWVSPQYTGKFHVSTIVAFYITPFRVMNGCRPEPRPSHAVVGPGLSSPGRA
jgi:hypothetical protein